MRRRFLSSLLIAAALAGGGWAAAQTGGTAGTGSLAAAKAEAEQARRRSELLERQAARATGEAAKARAEAAALAARIEAAEADITAGETRIRLIEALRRAQRARLAEKQAPLIRLTAALQTMARRPSALALVQPGSVNDLIRVRSLLASTLPVIRRRTAELRTEVERGNALRRQANTAVAALAASREDLKRRRIALARLEQSERARSESLRASALTESDRALAFGEEARDLAALAGTRQFQAELRQRLAQLPGPILRPIGSPRAPTPAAPAYILPVQGRVVTGLGEISDAGVHARGLTIATAASAEVIAPARGRVAYAGPFRGYGSIVILDHGGGWTTTLTNLASVAVRRGDTIGAGSGIGRASNRDPQIGIELRRNGAPFPIAQLITIS
ncbi:murein hydrolase activator EnvC [Sphingosinicella sp. BN140058]|uniref:murein hydrolase activator EnvC family protein n=1 Tax=Sphingosinicella sp. BN140058 TaxID=1892855 RepID=UPI001012C2A5|nr:peptidoglycan DD-metalloendopeptidase family protein [Sphingosinicella sp. BN140058]QAY75656.1 metalloendopeptidase [Sphingosinicella sp. BN140058]